jgi:hypothetical protein
MYGSQLAVIISLTDGKPLMTTMTMIVHTVREKNNLISFAILFEAD